MAGVGLDAEKGGPACTSPRLAQPHARTNVMSLPLLSIHQQSTRLHTSNVLAVGLSDGKDQWQRNVFPKSQQQLEAEHTALASNTALSGLVANVALPALRSRWTERYESHATFEVLLLSSQQSTSHIEN